MGDRHCSNLSRNLSRRPGGLFPSLTRIIKAVLLLGSWAIFPINWDCICFSVRGLGWLKLGFEIQKSTSVLIAGCVEPVVLTVSCKIRVVKQSKSFFLWRLFAAIVFYDFLTAEER